MEMIKSFIFEWRYVIIVVVAAIIYSIAEWNKVKSICYKLMLAAKELAQNKVLNAGKAEEDWVVNQLLAIIPMRYNLILNEDRTRLLVHFLFKQMKDAADDGKLNKSIK